MLKNLARYSFASTTVAFVYYIFVIMVWVVYGNRPAPKAGVPLFPPNQKASHINGPRDKNGDIDYLLHLNRHFADGVTSQNNFVAGTAPFLSLRVQQKSRFFKELGILSPKLDEPRLRPFETWFQEFQATASDAELETLRKLRFEAKDFGFAVYEPWSDKQFPHIRRYLDEHDPLLEKASDLLLRRPNAYVPYWQIRGLQEGKEFNFDFDSLFYANRDFKHDFFYFSYTDLKDAFRAESNSLLAKGRLIDARDEAFKIFRLSHSLSNTATLIESTSPCGYHNSAIHQISRIIKHPNVDLKFLEDLQEQTEKTNVYFRPEKRIVW